MVKMGVMDNNDLEDINEKAKNSEYNVQPKSFFGFDYNYRSETDDEDKYISNNNKNFYKLNKEAKRQHLLGLWRKAFNQSFGCAILINQFHTVHTKMIYFGRQVLAGKD